MKLLIKQWVLVLLLAIVGGSTVAQTTRMQLLQMQVGKEGDFKYWKPKSRSLADIKKFVEEVTTKGSKQFVPVQDRIAVVDLDGTLVCETAPYKISWMATLYRILDDSTYRATPEQKDVALQAKEMIEKKQVPTADFLEQLHEVQCEAFEGMAGRKLDAWMQRFMAMPCGDFEGLTWGTAFYLPMVELVNYLVANDFTVYLCTDADRDMARSLVAGVLPIKRQQVMGSDCHYVPARIASEMGGKMPAVADRYAFDQVRAQQPVRGKFKQRCAAYNKVDYIVREVGQKPILAIGNSTDDYAMFDYVKRSNPYPSMVLCLLADDTHRENGDRKHFVDFFRDCKENGWCSVSMNFDWETIYGSHIKPKNGDEAPQLRVLPPLQR